MSGTKFITNSPGRFNIFKQNVLSVLDHNNNNNGVQTYQRTINQFTGMFWNEVVGTAVMTDQNCSATIGSPITLPKGQSLPESIDLRATGVITPVKDQKTCGSSWAFSATGALEAYWALYTKIAPVLLSEQQLIDCAQGFGNNGCEGGLPSSAFAYITFNKGIDTENAYPYEAMDDVCRWTPDTMGAMVFGGSVNITQGDEESIMNALTTTGPVSVAFDVTADFLSYNTGVYTSTYCASSAASVNHAALIVGYGTDAATGLDYWLVKNSWGSSWGETGYFQIQRGVDMCGIAQCASYPNMAPAAPLGSPFHGFLSL